MYKILSVLLCITMVVSIPFYCLADEETTVESTSETETTEEIETSAEETTEVTEVTEETEAVFDESEINFDYYLVPMSSQIKVSWDDAFDGVGVYISSDNKNFEFLGYASDNYFIIDNLSHRAKYYVRLVVNVENNEIISEVQSVRVK